MRCQTEAGLYGKHNPSWQVSGAVQEVLVAQVTRHAPSSEPSRLLVATQLEPAAHWPVKLLGPPSGGGSGVPAGAHIGAQKLTPSRP